jgi:UDP-2,3-diacylglucosamine pyrophosphatase LpxH
VNGLIESASAGPALELIINGDLVDFLAERDPDPQPWVPFTPDPAAASRKLQAIAGRDADFFNSLKEFLARGHRLTILLGNHDIELALPQVRATLEQLLGVDGRQDFQLIVNGEAYIVGDALIEHGNRYDSFNVVDYDSLRRVSSLQSRRQAVPEKYAFDPPAGSKMVSWVINPIKEKYAFVDLLKPENGAVVPFLLALEPAYKKYLATAARLGLEARKHGLDEPAMPSFGGDIHADGDTPVDFGGDISSIPSAAPPPPEHHLFQLLEEHLKDDAEKFLHHIEGSTATAPSDTSHSIGDDISTFGETVETATGLLQLLLGGRTDEVEHRLPALWRALRALQNDQTFNSQVETAPEYLSAAQDLAAGGFRFVLFGHTHLRKRIALQGGATYLNSGTWVDLLRVPQEIISDDESRAMPKLREFVQVLSGGDLSPWILYEPTYIAMELGADGHIASADIFLYSGEVATSAQGAG